MSVFFSSSDGEDDHHQFVSSSEESWHDIQEHSELDNIKPLWDVNDPVEKQFTRDLQELGALPPDIRDPKVYGTTNTGPKGVKADYEIAKRRAVLYHQRENYKKIALAEKNTMTVAPVINDLYIEDEEMMAFLDEQDPQYANWRDQQIQKHIEQQTLIEKNKEMIKKQKKTFGGLIKFGREQYIEFIDDEEDNVTIVINVYEDFVSRCKKMNDCLSQISIKYHTIKFGCIKSSNTSLRFDDGSLPTLIVYKGKASKPEKTFIDVTTNFEDPHNFDFDDVEEFLLENNVATSEETNPAFDMFY
jgi:hypothetical protein